MWLSYDEWLFFVWKRKLFCSINVTLFVLFLSLTRLISFCGWLYPAGKLMFKVYWNAKTTFIKLLKQKKQQHFIQTWQQHVKSTQDPQYIHQDSISWCHSAACIVNIGQSVTYCSSLSVIDSEYFLPSTKFQVVHK